MGYELEASRFGNYHSVKVFGEKIHNFRNTSHDRIVESTNDRGDHN